MTRLQCMKYSIVVFFLAATSGLAQSTDARTDSGSPALVSKAAASSNLLRALHSSLETVVSKVTPAVVQIVVTGYGPSEDHGRTDTARFVRQERLSEIGSSTLDLARRKPATLPAPKFVVNLTGARRIASSNHALVSENPDAQSQS
jgi:hypothetical protein